jgi:hypothetical protein
MRMFNIIHLLMEYIHIDPFCANHSQTLKEKMYNFVIAQLSCKESMEHAFGVLQVCFHIIVNPFWLWDQKIILDILMAHVLI